jgi:integrase
MRKRKPRYQLNEGKFLTKDEEERLLKSLVSANQRDRLLVSVALRTGARASELLAVTLSDLRPHTQEVFLHGLKGSLDRAIPLPKTLFQELYEFAKTNCDTYVFDISYPRLVQVWDIYKPNGKSFHCLRHTFAIRLFERTQNLRLVQVALGHTNITNTMIYADYYYNAAELRKWVVPPEEKT